MGVGFGVFSLRFRATVKGVGLQGFVAVQTPQVMAI